MQLSKFVAGALGAAAISVAAPASATVINVSGLNDTGVTLALAAGTYTVTIAGLAGGGMWDAYSPWDQTTDCDANGMNCSRGYLAPFAVDFGHGGTNFNRVDGFAFGLEAVPGDNRIYQTAHQAFLAYSTGDLIYAALPQVYNPAAYSAVGGDYSFTLAAAQSVNFFIFDYPYGDNRDGVSLSVVGQRVGADVPEPATWALMILGFGAAGTALRRRRTIVAG